MSSFFRKDAKEFLVTLLFVLVFWFTIISFPESPLSVLGLKNLLGHLILGSIFAVIVTFVSPYPILTSKQIDLYFHTGTILRFLGYISRLTVDILLAGIDVARRVMRPKLLISPGIVEFETPLSEDIEIALNANSITLTPGTITIDAQKTPHGSRFLVHCISQDAVEATLREGGFVKRIQDCLYSEGQ
ncbi:MAG: Na+/H+ antiporter subunit E [bacterium]